MKVKEIMSTNVRTVERSAGIGEVAVILADCSIGGVPVVDEGFRVVGIITPKDLLYKDVEPQIPGMVEVQGSVLLLSDVRQYNEELRKIAASKAEDIMSREIISISEDDDVGKAARLMIDRDIGIIPVVGGQRLVGMVSRADMVGQIAKMLQPTH